MENNKTNQIKIGGLVKFSLLDYPEKLAAVVFTQGCNFKCSYCHNQYLINDENPSLIIKNDEVLKFLEQRKSKLDGVVITGGEPCYQNYDGLKDFITKVKEIGYSVKLDTNGSFPDIINKLIDSNLIDYIAMDVKTVPNEYDKLMKKEHLDKIQYPIFYHGIEPWSYRPIQNSIEIVRNFSNHEFRTTIFDKFDSNMIKNIMINIDGANKYILQTANRSNEGLKNLVNLYKETIDFSVNFNIKDYFVRKY